MIRRGDIGCNSARSPHLYTLRERVENTLPPSSANRAGGHDDGQVPGIVVVFSGGVAVARAIPLGDGPVQIGRDASVVGPGGKLDDGRVSRRHALITCNGTRCLVTDLGSQNGTSVDGERIAASRPTRVRRLLRVGDTLLVPCADVRGFDDARVQSIDGFVRGPAMLAVLDEVTRAARSGSTLHVRGESGTGKEGVAQAFHRASPRAARPLVAVNCAAIPHGIAERLLFGSKRGAYSGAEADAVGYIQEAEGGTLFLDEIAELDAQVQAKLLRALEAQEVLPLGASKPRRVEFGLCTATNKDLRALVKAGEVRDDFYFRIGRPAVLLPPLRERPEEIPTLIAHELARLPAAPTAHVSLVEQCLLRPWPGNVRELLAEIRSAAQAALPDSNRVEARHLAETAGSAFGAAMPDARPRPTRRAAGSSADWPRRRTPQVDDEWRRRIEESLRANGRNVAATARDLGLHRTQLRRLLERHGIAVDDDSGDIPSAR